MGKLENHENKVDICSNNEKLCEYKVDIDPVSGCKNNDSKNNIFSSPNGKERIFYFPFKIEMKDKSLPPSFDYRNLYNLWKKNRKLIIEYKLDFTANRPKQKPINISQK